MAPRGSVRLKSVTLEGKQYQCGLQWPENPYLTSSFEPVAFFLFFGFGLFVSGSCFVLSGVVLLSEVYFVCKGEHTFTKVYLKNIIFHLMLL